MIFLSVDITLREPVKIGLQSSQNGSGSLSYLPGSTIRGAIIGYLQKNTSIQIEDLLRKVCFDPAYPAVEGRALFPVPPVYFATKHEIRKAHRNAFPVSMSEQLDPEHRNPKKEEKQSAGAGKYGTIQGSEILTFDTEKTAKLHIATEQSVSGKAMFRYEAIAKGQKFFGLIRTEDETLAANIADAIKDTDLFIGGSKTAGYGRCHVTVKKLGNDVDRKKLYDLKEKKQGNLLIVYALSDLLLMDDDGVETGVPDPAFLQEKLGLTSVRFLGAQLTSRETIGFNSTWKAGPEVRGSVAAGSVWYYEADNTPDPASIRRLENEGIGLRRNEGYGDILINPDFTATKMKPLHTDTAEDTAKSQGKLDADSIAMLRKMQNKINNNRINIAMRDEALKCVKLNTGLTKKFSPSQIMRLLSLLEHILQGEGTESEDTAKGEAVRFRSDLKTGTLHMYETIEIILNRAHNTHWTLNEALDKLADDQVSFKDYAGTFPKVDLVSLTREPTPARSSFYMKAEYLYLVLYDLIRKEGAEE